MSMFINKKYSKDLKQFNETRNTSKDNMSSEAVSQIYEAGKAYYEYLRSSKSQRDDTECDYCTAFMMF
ncbi:hypothetical protein [Clostridium aciditolerans]|nr:hypothetical protein [Clostridium aciditolerans]